MRARSAISVDWRRLWESLFRFVTGVGLVVFWLLLIAVTVAILVWAGSLVARLSFAWILGIIASIPVLTFIWWLSYHIALDGLSDVGIELRGFWAWSIIPVAPLLAPLSFFVMYLSGIGRFLKSPLGVRLSFALGVLLFLVLFVAILLT